jgi:diguanylate cyclase (GGDEF)-like protein
MGMELKSWFGNQKIQFKLMLINVLVIVIALFPIVLVLFGYEFYAVRKATLQEVRVQAAIVSDNAAAAVAFGDAVTATEALATLQASPDVMRAALLQPDGSVLATYNWKDISLSADNLNLNKNPTDETLTEDGFSYRKQVFLKGNFVGYLVLEASLESLYQRMWLYFGVILWVVLLCVALSFWLAMKLEESIVRPLANLIGTVQRVTINQDYSMRPVVESEDEIGQLSLAFRNMMSIIQERDSRLQDLAYFDSVTALPNRHYFQERIEEVVSSTIERKQRCCLMLIDLDDFKIVNDTYGHHVGDDLLRVVGKRISSVLRKNDIVCRIGGDEFALILENNNDDAVIRMLADRVIETVSKPTKLHGCQVKVGASIGISICPDHALDTSDLLKSADTAMYTVKGKRKNAYHVYDSDESEKESETSTIG